MQEFFVLFVQLFGGLNFKEKRKCKQLARGSCVCTRFILCVHISLPSWAPAVCPVILQPQSKMVVSKLNGDRMNKQTEGGNTQCVGRHYMCSKKEEPAQSCGDSE